MNSLQWPKSKELYLASVADLKNYPAQGVDLWSSFYDTVVSHNVPLIDRTRKVSMPYAFKLYDPFEMPTDLAGFDLTYSQCCEARAADLLELSQRQGRPILFFYSGGIDSTIVAISFIKAAESANLLRDRVVVAMTPDSIAENPAFYYQHIRPNFTLVSSEHFNHIFTDNYIIVGGEHNDQLFGSDIVGKIDSVFGFDEVNQDYKTGMIKRWFINNHMTEAQASYWFDLLVWHAENGPCEIKTSFDLLWWLNFNFKWQSVYFRMLLRISPTNQSKISHEWMQEQFHHFFSDQRFQKWSMLNPQLKIKSSWQSYKFHAKQTIHEFTGDTVYKNDKLKRGSLFKLFLSKTIPAGLTADLEFVYKLDPQQLYRADNAFTGNQPWNT
jgi:hypothetical protein